MSMNHRDSTPALDGQGSLTGDTVSFSLSVLLGSADLGRATAGLAELVGATTPEPELRDGVWKLQGPIVRNGIRYSILALAEAGDIAFQNLRYEATRLARETICLVLLGNHRVPLLPLDPEDPNAHSVTLIPMYSEDLDALAQGEAVLERLLLYKLYLRLSQDYPESRLGWQSTRYQAFLSRFRNGNGPSLDHEFIDEKAVDALVQHPLLPRVMRALDRQSSCLLVGPSSSGKTVLASQVAASNRLAGNHIVYLNLSSSEDRSCVIAEQIIFGRMDGLLIVDDVQSNPAEARFVLSITSAAKRIQERPNIQTLAISWEEFAEVATKWLADCLPLAVRASQIQSELVSNYRQTLTDRELNSISKNFGTDLFLLHLCLDISKQQGTAADIQRVAEEAWRRKTENAEISNDSSRRVAIVAASLGRYDIATPQRFLVAEAQVEPHAVDALRSSGLLRFHGEHVVLGHRSLCGLFADWLDTQGVWSTFPATPKPRDGGQVILDYLQSLGASLAVDTLRGLFAKAGFKERTRLHGRAASLVQTWQAFDVLAQRLEKQQVEDPTWSRTPSSAMFAAQTLMLLGKPAAGEGAVAFLQALWQVANGTLKININGLATIGDFKLIRKKMKKQDSFDDVPHLTPTSDIDMDRFHRSWLMGVLLCAEAAASSPRSDLGAFVTAIESEALDSGAFYPERVPWVTGRILLGLAACGRTVDTSATVRTAVDWLLREVADGGAFRGSYWEGGTGTWNSRLNTTGTVLLALCAVGYDSTDPRIGQVMDFLKAEIAIEPSVLSGEEVSVAQGIQAYLEAGGAWDYVAPDAGVLSRWARSEGLWETATSSAERLHLETCNVAQIAWHLIGIAWKAIRADLPSLLDALALPKSYVVALKGHQEPKHPRGVKQVDLSMAESQASVGEAIKAAVLSVDKLSLEEYLVVGKYYRYNQQIRNSLKKQVDQISNPLVSENNSYENFLIWGEPASGKTFLVEQIAKSLEGAITFVPLNPGLGRKAFEEGAKQILDASSPVLSLFDESDEAAEERWPFELLLPILEENLRAGKQTATILAGSSSTGMQGFKRTIADRWKGKDVLSRIPENRQFEIPALGFIDRVVVFSEQVLNQCLEAGKDIHAIEKLVFLYVLMNDELRSPRKLAALAIDAAGRIQTGGHEIVYEDLFDYTDRRKNVFWAKHTHLASELSNVYTTISNDLKRGADND